jgi:3-deoxy-7-phosphoheptulonate synthase
VLKSARRQQSVVSVPHLKIGGGEFVTMAGPCSVETEIQLMATAHHVRRAGAHILRGGAFKPRSSPYAFQGHGLKGLKMLAKAREATGLAIVTEVMSEEDVPMVAEYADILQIGTRNMENYALLEAAAHSGRPVLLKRGMVANRHRGESFLSSPATPPDKRVRIRRFEKLRLAESRDTQTIGPSDVQHLMQEHSAVAPPATSIPRHLCRHFG